MSMKSKLLAKTGDLLTPPAPLGAPAGDVGLGTNAKADELPAAASIALPQHSPQEAVPKFPGVVPGAGARTAPGQMLQFRGELQAKELEVAQLKLQLESHRDALPTRHLEPTTIGDSAWANRHEAAFRSAEFESLKRDIQASGGNIQPIRVRPVQRADGVAYEVVFGHRRLRACRELGLPVLAMVDAEVKDDLTLFALMDRENRERADLSPYEQGLAYKRALDAGLFPSRRRLAEALEVSHTWVSNVLTVAELPLAIIECFSSPLEIQHRHAKILGEALARDGRAVLKRAEKLRQLSTRLKPTSVVASLVASEPKSQASVVEPLKLGNTIVGKLTSKPDGSLQVELASSASDPARRDQVLKALSIWLDKAAAR